MAKSQGTPASAEAAVSTAAPADSAAARAFAGPNSVDAQAARLAPASASASSKTLTGTAAAEAVSGPNSVDQQAASPVHTPAAPTDSPQLGLQTTFTSRSNPAQRVQAAYSESGVLRQLPKPPQADKLDHIGNGRLHGCQLSSQLPTGLPASAVPSTVTEKSTAYPAAPPSALSQMSILGLPGSSGVSHASQLSAESGRSSQVENKATSQVC